MIIDTKKNAKWIEDIDLLVLELPKRHKNLFFNKGEANFYRDIEQLKSNIDYFDDYEIRVQLAKIVADIGDAHTSISLPVNLLCPIELYWFSDGIYVISTLPEYEEIQYCKITHVNDIPIDEIISEISSIVSYENQSLLKSLLPKYLPAIELLYGLEIVDEIDKLELIFEDKNRNEKKLEIKALPIKEAKKELMLNNHKNNRGMELPLYRKNSEKYYWFEYIGNLKIVYFKYNSCRNMEDKSVREFGEELIKFINENDVEKLIIDLRNNYGGNSTLLEPFIDSVIKCEKINKKGHLFVIIGRQTFSSAMLNIFYLKETTNAIFLGEPTGGKPNCYGEVERFNLKNSRLLVCYSTKYYSIIEDDDLETFRPDITFELTIANYEGNEDPCVEYIIGD